MDFFADLKVSGRNERRSIKGWQWNELLDRIEQAFINIQLEIASTNSGTVTEPDEGDIIVTENAEDRETLDAVGFVEIIIDTDGSLKYRAIVPRAGVRINLGNYDDLEIAAEMVAENGAQQ